MTFALNAEPIATLIAGRLAQLGINLHGLASRLGYINTNKGSRRLQSLMEGRLAAQDELLGRLAHALEVSDEEVARAVQETEAAKERSDQATFVPHAVIVTERTVPSQITLCALTRGEEALWITLDITRPRATFARQALIEIGSRTESGRREIPFFGAAKGFVVNYAPPRAVRFDLEGQALELMAACSVGTPTLTVKGKSLRGFFGQ